VFTITDRAISPLKAHYAAALKRLPEAHRQATAVATTHLHGHVSQAIESAGLDPAPFQVGWRKGMPYLGIEPGPAGDRLFDHEFGTPDSGPSPVIRTAITRHHPAANALYGHALRSRLGI
jgi:hypothetical protein